MPWKIEERDGKFCVVKKDSGETEKCYDNRGEAEDYMKALYASEEDDGSGDDMDDMKAWVAPLIDERIETARKGIMASVAEALSNVMGRRGLVDGNTSGFRAFKAKDGATRWVGWYSNAFKDRDAEFFPAKAIDEYVMRVDTGVVPTPELWLMHVPGSKVGAAEWVDRIGLISVAVGHFDETPVGQKAATFFAGTDQRWTMSHGFFFDARQKEDGAFYQFNTFEVSPLPAGWEANPYTQFEALEEDMALSEAKRHRLVEMLGDDLAEQIITATEMKSKALQEAGIAYKDMPEMTDESAAEKQSDDDLATDDVQVLTTLVTDNAELTGGLVRALKEAQDIDRAHREQVDALTARVKALEEMIAMRPSSASESPETVIDEKAIPAHVKDAMKTVDPFWGVTVNRP